MPHQLFAAVLQARDIYPGFNKCFYGEHSNVTWEEFLTTKFGLWIEACSSTNNTLHGSGRAIEKSGILLQIEKAPEASNGDLTCYVFSLEDAVAHLSDKFFIFRLRSVIYKKYTKNDGKDRKYTNAIDISII